MAEPSFYSEGSAPRLRDTQLVTARKWLGAIQNSLGGSALAENNPSPNDTIKDIERKINSALYESIP